MSDRQKIRELHGLVGKPIRRKPPTATVYSPYAPAKGCRHEHALDVTPPLTPEERAMPLDHPRFWDVHIRIRQWICADCQCEVDPHAYRWPA